MSAQPANMSGRGSSGVGRAGAGKKAGLGQGSGVAVNPKQHEIIRHSLGKFYTKEDGSQHF